LSGQDVIQLLDTQAYFDLLNLPYPTDQQGVLEFLKTERLIQEVAGNYSILNMGVILLAKKLGDFPSVGRKAARVVVYSGESKMDTSSDITGEKGYAVGFKGLVQYVMSQLPQNEIIEDAIRKEVMFCFSWNWTNALFE